MTSRPIPLAYFAMVFFASHTIADELPPYEGTWSYDIEKSSAYIMSTGQIPQVFRDIIAKEGSYYPDGLSLVFTADSFGAGLISGGPAEIELHEIRVIEHTASHLRFEVIEPGKFKGSELTIYFEDGCLYYFETRWKIKSYYCKAGNAHN